MLSTEGRPYLVVTYVDSRPSGHHTYIRTADRAMDIAVGELLSHAHGFTVAVHLTDPEWSVALPGRDTLVFAASSIRRLS